MTSPRKQASRIQRIHQVIRRRRLDSAVAVPLLDRLPGAIPCISRASLRCLRSRSAPTLRRALGHLTLAAVFGHSPAALAADASKKAASASNVIPVSLFKLIEEKKYAAALPRVTSLAAQKNQHAQFVLASYYSCGKIVPFSCSKADALFKASMNTSNGAPENGAISQAAPNEVAWLHATCTQDGFVRDLETAKAYAMEAMRRDNNAFALDTFAAVAARAGEFKAAMSFQRMAISKLEDMAKAEQIPAAAFVDFKKHLDSYEQGQPTEVTADTAAASCNLLPD
ncbi:hypothetical protein LNV23_07875 [Paucibacter sp. DJ1R-11]|uniref:hypothetical protein n=1 Tax=Paucibacter sp. DJ1R-11 TaxID=2893556 RepID=UPI0021E51705|nr:hypothetical protein [Paucibacter sp. DJ1R-11]MCV2363365.1 hypothetical protein [Paucibacter sp. DJ1R-11]